MPKAKTTKASKASASQNGQGSSNGKRKRVVPPPPQLDPQGLYSSDNEIDEYTEEPLRKRPAVDASRIPSTSQAGSSTQASASSQAGSSQQGLNMPGAFPMFSGQPLASSSRDSVPPPTLSVEAQLEAFRQHLDMELNGKDDELLDIDQGGPDQALEMQRFMDERNKFGEIPSVQDAMETIGITSARQLVPGLDVHLLPHQLIGVSWMLKKERNHRERGGILADDMGLGKTVQALALMVVNTPDLENDDPEGERRKQTLIIAPAALLDQWKDEIETKADMFRVFVHHGSNKAKTAQALRKYDVVITSFTTMLYDIQPRQGKVKGPLFNTKWFRIIIDEAQIIRNRLGATSIAACRLDSRYRWLLTGTPFTNGLHDLYPLLRFARLRPWNDWQSFKEHIGAKVAKEADEATRMTATVVKKHLLRRKKDDKLDDGQPILQLLPKHIEEEMVDFTAEERKIYDAVEKRQQQMISKFIKRGTLIKNYQFVLVMILRLRQVCCHPQLIAYAAGEIADPNAEPVLGDAYIFDDGEGRNPLEVEHDITSATNLMGQAMVTKLKATFEARVKAQLHKETSDDADDIEENRDDECPICFDIYTNPRVTVCGHVFCKDCIEGVLNAQVEYMNDDGQPPPRPCPSCRQEIRENQLFKATLFEPSKERRAALKRQVEREQKSKGAKDMPFSISLEDSEDELPDADEWWAPKKKEKKDKKGKKSIQKASTKGKGKGKAVEDESDDDIIDLTAPRKSRASMSPSKGLSKKGKKKSALDSSSDADSMDSGSDSDDSDAENPFKAEMLDGLADFENSAKMQSMVDLLKQWRDENPSDKCVVYSQWTSCMDLLEAALEREVMRCLRYDGKMTREERNDVIKRFKKGTGANILLVSLKCGGVGLNLVEANRVICFDPAWNYAAESQAYDRVHRIGQTKEVFVKRLVVRDSIEERILRIQQGKKELTDAALGEGSGRSLRGLNFKDILKLFNMRG